MLLIGLTPIKAQEKMEWIIQWPAPARVEPVGPFVSARDCRARLELLKKIVPWRSTAECVERKSFGKRIEFKD